LERVRRVYQKGGDNMEDITILEEKIERLTRAAHYTKNFRNWLIFTRRIDRYKEVLKRMKGE